MGTLIFNVDGAAKGKPAPTEISGMLQDVTGEILIVLCGPMGVKIFQ